MMERTRWFFYEWRHTQLTLGLVVLSGLSFLHLVAGSFDPGNLPWYFSSESEFLGMVLLVILMPAYIAVVGVYGLRRSRELAVIVDSTGTTNLTTIVTQIPFWPTAAMGFIGFLYAVIFNIHGNLLNFFSVDAIERAISIGQLAIWILLGCLLAIRGRIAIAFRRISEQVAVDIFEPTNLKPFAQIGLIDVLTITAGMVLSSVQSMDFSFRFDNYGKALIIVVPAMFYLAIYPMWGIHKKMKQMRQQQLEELNALIFKSPKDLGTTNMNQLESLLQRRERVSSAATWPIDLATLQRFLFYIIIPPLAWIGAALVEFVINGLIQG